MALIGLIVFMKPRAEYWWYGLLCGVGGAMIFALYQGVVLHIDRAYGTRQPIIFGNLAMVMGLMSLASIQRFAGTRLTLLPYIAFLAGLATSILSGSRGGWPALILAIVPFYLYRKNLIRHRIATITAMSIASLLIVACFIPQLKIGSRITGLVTDIHQYNQGNVDTSSGARLELWKAALNIFSENPLMGVGRNNFHAKLGELIDHNEIVSSVRIFEHAHNEILNELATGGVPGATLLLFLYIAPLAFFIKILRCSHYDNAQPYALAGLLMVLSFIIFGLTEVMFVQHVGAGFYALSIAILAGLCIRQNKIGLSAE